MGMPMPHVPKSPRPKMRPPSEKTMQSHKKLPFVGKKGTLFQRVGWKMGRSGYCVKLGKIGWYSGLLTGDMRECCGYQGFYVDLAQPRFQRHPSPAPHLHTPARLLWSSPCRRYASNSRGYTSGKISCNFYEGPRNHDKEGVPVPGAFSDMEAARNTATIMQCRPGTMASCQTFDMLLPRLVYTPQVEASMGWPRWLHSKGLDYGHRACLTGWAVFARDLGDSKRDEWILCHHIQRWMPPWSAYRHRSTGCAPGTSGHWPGQGEVPCLTVFWGDCLMQIRNNTVPNCAPVYEGSYSYLF